MYQNLFSSLLLQIETVSHITSSLHDFFVKKKKQKSIKVGFQTEPFAINQQDHHEDYFLEKKKKKLGRPIIFPFCKKKINKKISFRIEGKRYKFLF
jgi:hypothetical protein